MTITSSTYKSPMGPGESELSGVRKDLERHLDVKDLGKLQSLLGVIFLSDDRSGWLTQRSYVLPVLQWFGMSLYKPAATQMPEAALKESEDNSTLFEDRKKYQKLLGCFMFIDTRKRPDISAVVSILSRYASKTSIVHWTQLKRVLRSTAEYALRIYRDVREGNINALCEANWAGDRVDRNSTTGVFIRHDATKLPRRLRSRPVLLDQRSFHYRGRL